MGMQDDEAMCVREPRAVIARSYHVIDECARVREAAGPESSALPSSSPLAGRQETDECDERCFMACKLLERSVEALISRWEAGAEGYLASVAQASSLRARQLPVRQSRLARASQMSLMRAVGALCISQSPHGALLESIASLTASIAGGDGGGGQHAATESIACLFESLPRAASIVLTIADTGGTAASAEWQRRKLEDVCRVREEVMRWLASQADAVAPDIAAGVASDVGRDASHCLFQLMKCLTAWLRRRQCSAVGAPAMADVPLEDVAWHPLVLIAYKVTVSGATGRGIMHLMSEECTEAAGELLLEVMESSPAAGGCWARWMPPPALVLREPAWNLPLDGMFNGERFIPSVCACGPSRLVGELAFLLAEAVSPLSASVHPEGGDRADVATERDDATPLLILRAVTHAASWKTERIDSQTGNDSVAHPYSLAPLFGVGSILESFIGVVRLRGQPGGQGCIPPSSAMVACLHALVDWIPHLVHDVLNGACRAHHKSTRGDTRWSGAWDNDDDEQRTMGSFRDASSDVMNGAVSLCWNIMSLQLRTPSGANLGASGLRAAFDAMGEDVSALAEAVVHCPDAGPAMVWERAEAALTLMAGIGEEMYCCVSDSRGRAGGPHGSSMMIHARTIVAQSMDRVCVLARALYGSASTDHAAGGPVHRRDSLLSASYRMLRAAYQVLSNFAALVTSACDGGTEDAVSDSRRLATAMLKTAIGGVEFICVRNANFGSVRAADDAVLACADGCLRLHERLVEGLVRGGDGVAEASRRAMLMDVAKEVMNCAERIAAGAQAHAQRAAPTAPNAAMMSISSLYLNMERRLSASVCELLSATAYSDCIAARGTGMPAWASYLDEAMLRDFTIVLETSGWLMMGVGSACPGRRWRLLSVLTRIDALLGSSLMMRADDDAGPGQTVSPGLAEIQKEIVRAIVVHPSQHWEPIVALIVGGSGQRGRTTAEDAERTAAVREALSFEDMDTIVSLSTKILVRCVEGYCDVAVMETPPLSASCMNVPPGPVVLRLLSRLTTEPCSDGGGSPGGRFAQTDRRCSSVIDVVRSVSSRADGSFRRETINDILQFAAAASDRIAAEMRAGSIVTDARRHALSELLRATFTNDHTVRVILTLPDFHFVERATVALVLLLETSTKCQITERNRDDGVDPVSAASSVIKSIRALFECTPLWSAIGPDSSRGAGDRETIMEWGGSSTVSIIVGALLSRSIDMHCLYKAADLVLVLCQLPSARYHHHQQTNSPVASAFATERVLFWIAEAFRRRGVGVHTGQGGGGGTTVDMSEWALALRAGADRDEQRGGGSRAAALRSHKLRRVMKRFVV